MWEQFSLLTEGLVSNSFCYVPMHCFLQLFRISSLFSSTGSSMLISALTSKGSLWRHPHRNNSGRGCLYLHSRWRGRLCAAHLQLLSSFIWSNFISDISKWIAVWWSRDISVYLWRLWNVLGSKNILIRDACMMHLCTWCARVFLLFVKLWRVCCWA